MATVTSSKRHLVLTSDTYTSNGDVVVGGDLTVQGTTTTLDTANLLVEDKNIIIGNVSSPSDTTADGGGITLKGATDKTISWSNANNRWDLNQGISVTGDIAVTGTVDGVDISALPTSFASTDAEANVQANWTETTTTSDAFILNKPTIPTDHGDHDGLYLEKIYTGNWTIFGYGDQGGVRYHKLATITVTAPWCDYNATFDWTGRYASGTAGIHISSSSSTDALIYGAWYEDFNPTRTLEETNGYIKYTISGPVVEIWVKTDGWREFDYIRKDSVTQGSPTVTWYDETTTTDQATEPSNLNAFTNRTHTAAGYSTATGVADNAEVNVQADWTETTTTSDSFILNKPTIPTVPDSYAPTDAEANVQADWTAADGDAHILNKPTTFAPSAHNHDDRYYTETEVTAFLADKTDLNHIRSLGTQAFTNGTDPSITTAQIISEIEFDGGFDSYSSVFKTSWSYAGNYNLTDAGRFTETAGSSWITWTDNSSDTTRGNITALAIAPNTGGSSGKVFIYNDQGPSYAPGWREVWTSTSDGTGSGLDADKLDGQEGTHYLDYNNFTNTPTIPTDFVSATTGGTFGGDVNVFPNAGTGTFRVGRYAGQEFKLHATDLINTITSINDEDENQTHDFILNREHAGTGANNFKIQKGGTDQLSIDNDGQVTITGDLSANNLSGTNTGDQDLSGYATTSHNHDGIYLRTHTRYQDDLDTITTSGVYIWDVSEADDEPTGAADGLLTIKYWDSSSWATASFQDFHNRTLHIKSKKNGTWQTDWAQVWTTDQLTTTNKTNYDTAYTHSQATHAPTDAEANVQADWTATSGDALILNKPTTLAGYGITDAVTSTTIDTYWNRGYKNKHLASNLAVGWYTIATNTGDRALAQFQIWDTASSDHQSVLFNASHHFGIASSNDITVTANSRYSGTNFRYIRIKERGTYDGAALQVYVDGTSNSCNVAIVGGNAQESGWVIKDWVADATDPGDVSSYSNFTEACKVDLDKVIDGGYISTGDMYINTDQRVMTYAGGTFTGEINSPTLSGTNTGDQDLSGYSVTSHSHSNYITSNADDTASGTYTFTGSAKFALDSTFTNSEVRLPATTDQNPRIMFYRPTGSAATSYPWRFQAGGGGSSSSFYIGTGSSANNGSETIANKLSISSTGTLTVSGDVIAYGSPSDAKYKENVKPIENALDKVMDLEGVSFDWKENSEVLDIKEDIGFIAQDVQKVIPELVKENEDGNLSLRYQGLIPVLLEAMKQQQKQIDELKSQISSCNIKQCNCT